MPITVEESNYCKTDAMAEQTEIPTKKNVVIPEPLEERLERLDAAVTRCNHELSYPNVVEAAVESRFCWSTYCDHLLLPFQADWQEKATAKLRLSLESFQQVLGARTLYVNKQSSNGLEGLSALQKENQYLLKSLNLLVTQGVTAVLEAAAEYSRQ